MAAWDCVAVTGNTCCVVGVEEVEEEAWLGYRVARAGTVIRRYKYRGSCSGVACKVERERECLVYSVVKVEGSSSRDGQGKVRFWLLKILTFYSLSQ